jgi:hypothetical protein
MKSILLPIVAALLLPSLHASAQTPPQPAPAPKPSDAECAQNPFKSGCDDITILPGAPGTGLKPQWSEPGLIPKGLRPMDAPSFDRNSLRLPKS